MRDNIDDVDGNDNVEYVKMRTSEFCMQMKWFPFFLAYRIALNWQRMKMWIWRQNPQNSIISHVRFLKKPNFCTLFSNKIYLFYNSHSQNFVMKACFSFLLLKTIEFDVMIVICGSSDEIDNILSHWKASNRRNIQPALTSLAMLRLFDERKNKNDLAQNSIHMWVWIDRFTSFDKQDVDLIPKFEMTFIWISFNDNVVNIQFVFNWI